MRVYMNQYFHRRPPDHPMHTARCLLQSCVRHLVGVFLRTQEIDPGDGLWASLTKPGESYEESLGWHETLAFYRTLRRERRRRGEELTTLALSASRARPWSICCSWMRRSAGGDETKLFAGWLVWFAWADPRALFVWLCSV